MKILVCDGDASARSVLRRLLMLANGSDVVECGTGAEAIELLDDGSFDAMLLDTQLPVLDGFETLRVIRDTPHLKHLPVAIVTSDRTSVSVQRAVELSVADYILKPMRLHRLQTGLKAIAARAQTETRVVAQPQPAVTIDQRTRVLVVDGDADFREFLTSLLAPYCTVTAAASGASALNDAWTSGPSLAFIGRDLGPVGPAALVRNLTRLGTRTFVKLANPEDVETEKGSRLYSDVIGRTLVSAAMLRELKRFISSGGGPLQRLMGHVPDLRTVLVRTTASTFGMMLSQEVDVVEPDDTDIVGAHAVVEMTVDASTAARVEIQCATDLTRQLAAATLGDDVELEAAASVLGEMSNVITGKLQSTLLERGVTCVCSLPSFGPGVAVPSRVPGDAERMVVEMSPSGSGERFRIVLDVYLAEAASGEQPDDALVTA